MNCFVVCDLNWDNIPLVMKRLSYLREDMRVNILYNKLTNVLSKYCHDNNLNLMRRSIKRTEDLVGILSVMDFCLVFTDFIEYNTPSSFVLETANANNIPCFVFSNTTSKYIYRGEIHEIKFKKVIANLEKRERKNLSHESRLLEFEKIIKNINLDDSVQKLREKYAEISERKQDRSIIIVP